MKNLLNRDYQSLLSDRSIQLCLYLNSSQSVGELHVQRLLELSIMLMNSGAMVQFGGKDYIHAELNLKVKDTNFEMKNILSILTHYASRHDFVLGVSVSVASSQKFMREIARYAQNKKLGALFTQNICTRFPNEFYLKPVGMMTDTLLENKKVSLHQYVKVRETVSVKNTQVSYNPIADKLFQNAKTQIDRGYDCGAAPGYEVGSLEIAQLRSA